MNIPLQFFIAFNKITYHDDVHKYFIGDQQLTSTTTLIHKFVNEFDENYWSETKALEYKLTKEQVLYSWKFLNIFSQYKGSAVHNYAENLFQQKIFPYNNEQIIKEFGYDAVKDEIEKVKIFVNNFYQDTKEKLIPIKPEMIIYLEEFGIAGMVDIPMFNIKPNCFQVWDWKTNKELKMESKYRMKAPLDYLDDCEFVHYSLQLGIYKYIFEKKTGLHWGDNYIVWLNENNDNYKIIKCIDLQYDINMLLNYCLENGILKPVILYGNN